MKVLTGTLHGAEMKLFRKTMVDKIIEAHTEFFNETGNAATDIVLTKGEMLTLLQDVIMPFPLVGKIDARVAGMNIHLKKEGNTEFSYSDIYGK